MTMNKKIKYQSAIIASKLVHRTLKLFGRNSTHMPGHIALKIDPELLKTLPMPQHRLAITGTNGKTSVSNLISAFLRYKQFDVINNSYGSNILQGTTTALLSGTNILGNQTKPWSVLEVDELASRFLLPDYQPQHLIVTNLFRDSYRRNAHVDFIVTRLNQAIGDNTHLLLNGDDLISSMLKPNNARSYFSIRPLPHETSNSDALINDLPICPQCNHPLTYTFQHYHHIGKATCSNCHFSNPKPDYEIIDRNPKTFILKYQEELYEFPSFSDNLTDLYNALATIASLHLAGFTFPEIQEGFPKLQLPTTRYEETIVANKRFVTIMGKDQNPVAVTRAFDYIRRQTNQGNIGIFMANPPNKRGVLETENIAYLYDVNFEYLNQSFIKRVGFASARYLDYMARLEFAGYPKNQILGKPHEEELLDVFNIDDLDTIYLIPGTKNLPLMHQVKQSLIQKAKEAST